MFLLTSGECPAQAMSLGHGKLSWTKGRLYGFDTLRKRPARRSRRLLIKPLDKRLRRLTLHVRNERGEGHPTAAARARHKHNEPPLPGPLLVREERQQSRRDCVPAFQSRLENSALRLNPPCT